MQPNHYPSPEDFSSRSLSENADSEEKQAAEESERLSIGDSVSGRSGQSSSSSNSSRTSEFYGDSDNHSRTYSENLPSPLVLSASESHRCPLLGCEQVFASLEEILIHLNHPHPSIPLPSNLPSEAVTQLLQEHIASVRELANQFFDVINGQSEDTWI